MVGGWVANGRARSAANRIHPQRKDAQDFLERISAEAR
jgi:hypothetical protein